MILGQTQPFASPEVALAHHGIKGMRWGVRKKQETSDRQPAGKTELSEKDKQRVDTFLKKANIAETRISELKVRNEALKGTRNLAQTYELGKNRQAITDLEAARKRAISDAEAVEKGKLTSKQKAIITGALGAGILAASFYGAAAIGQGYQSGALNAFKLRIQARLKGQSNLFNINKDLARPMSPNELLNEVAKPVNPLYSSMGGKMNCRRSTYAYELRRRGFDVRATTSAVGWGQSESGVINAVTPGGKKFYSDLSVSTSVVKTGFSTVAKGDIRSNPIKKIFLDNLEAPLTANAISSSKKVLDELGKQPNGARGEVLFKFPGFGHSMAYEVVNGVPHIFDSQKGTHYNMRKRVESKWDGFTGAEITRLDNANLDLDFLSRWATNRG